MTNSENTAQEVVPLALHPLAIERHRARDAAGKHVPDAALGAALQAMVEGRALAEQASHAHAAIMADPLMPAAGRLVRARKTTGSLAEVIVKKLDVARVKLTTELHNIQRDTSRLPPSTSPASIAIERQTADVLRSMPDADRRKVIMQAIERDDESVLSSLFSGPAFVVGLDDKTREAYRQQFRKKRWPEVVERETRLRAALADIERAGGATVAWVERLFSASPIEKLVAASEAATSAVAAAKASEGDGA
jgi:hypothetical protein